MEGSKILSFEDIEAANDTGERDVEIAEWGGSVRIRPLTMAEVQQARKKSSRHSGPNGAMEQDADLFQMYLVLAGLIQPKLTDALYQRLLKKRAGAVNKIVTAVLEAAGLTQEAAEQVKDSFREEPGA